MADRDIVTAFSLQLLTKMLETGNILQQETHMIHFEVFTASLVIVLIRTLVSLFLIFPFCLVCVLGCRRELRTWVRMVRMEQLS